MPVPLTTIFSAPSTYFSTVTLDRGGNKLEGSASNVLPSGAEPTDRNFAFSPALYCPLSHTQATTSTISRGPNAIETRAVCCPVPGIPELAGYAFLYNPDSTGWEWYSTLGCSLSANVNLTMPYSTEGTTTLLTRGAQINAFSVQIAWQSSDSTITAAATLSNTIISSSPTTLTTSIQPVNTSADNTSSPSGLVTSAKIAIGVIIPLAILFLLFATFLFIRKKRRTMRKSLGTPLGPGIVIDTDKN